MYDILIIGGGPAGLTAAIYAARAGLNVAIIEKTVAGGQITSTHNLENYPGFEHGIAGAEFSQILLMQTKRFGANFILDEILSLQLDGDIKEAKGREGNYQAKTVILALGASSRKLNIPGEEKFTGMGISYCATCDGAFFRKMSVAVIGGGDTAFEDALYLSDLAKDVYIIHRRDQFRAQQYLVKKAESKRNIHFIMQSIPVEIQGNMSIENIILQNVKSKVFRDLPIEGVFVAVGQQPNTTLLQNNGIALDEAGYILAGEDTKTNISGVYAVGDVRRKNLRQVITAAADGAIAAMAAYHKLALED